MTLTIDVHDLKDRMHELEQASGEVVITAGSEVIARLQPREISSSAQVEVPAAARLSDPFAGEWTAEDTRSAKAAAASCRYWFTAEQVMACVRALEKT